MYFRFTTLSLIAAIVMSSVSAISHADLKGTTNVISAQENLVSDQARTGLVTATKRSYLSRRKVAAVLERRNNSCNHKNHKNYRKGDEARHHRHHHCVGDYSLRCGDSDSDEWEHRFEHDEYDDDEFDDDDDYFECDECDHCDDDYMRWSDYEDEITK